MMSDEDFIREVEKSERTLYRVSKTMLRNARIAATLCRKR